jgi:hypothetical protein
MDQTPPINVHITPPRLEVTEDMNKPLDSLHVVLAGSVADSEQHEGTVKEPPLSTPGILY